MTPAATSKIGQKGQFSNHFSSSLGSVSTSVEHSFTSSPSRSSSSSSSSFSSCLDGGSSSSPAAHSYNNRSHNSSIRPPLLKKVDESKLMELKERWPTLLEEARKAGHDVEADPYLTLEPEGLLQRFLIATDGNVDESAERIRRMLEWRRLWRVLDYYKPGMAQHLFSDVSNPGAEMYFSHSCHTDVNGRPFMIGRIHYSNPANMHPWRHLRAAIFVMERMATEVLRMHCGYGSYILDVGEVPAAGTVSGTGGPKLDCNGEKIPEENPHKKEQHNPYYRRGAGKEAPPELVKCFGDLSSGMGVLRAAIAIGGQHYPELNERMVMLRSNWLFYAAFRVFSMWMHPHTREKVVFVESGWGSRPMSALKEWFGETSLPVEFGGSGWSLGGDSFIRRAIELYDSDPSLPSLPSSATPRYAGWTEEERRQAEQDSIAKWGRPNEDAKSPGSSSCVEEDLAVVDLTVSDRPRESCCCGLKVWASNPRSVGSRVGNSSGNSGSKIGISTLGRGRGNAGTARKEPEEMVPEGPNRLTSFTPVARQISSPRSALAGSPSASPQLPLRIRRHRLSVKFDDDERCGRRPSSSSSSSFGRPLLRSFVALLWLCCLLACALVAAKLWD